MDDDCKRQLDQAYPFAINLFQHGFIAVNMWIEMFLIPHGVSSSFRVDASMLR